MGAFAREMYPNGLASHRSHCCLGLGKEMHANFSQPLSSEPRMEEVGKHTRSPGNLAERRHGLCLESQLGRLASAHSHLREIPTLRRDLPRGTLACEETQPPHLRDAAQIPHGHLSGQQPVPVIDLRAGYASQ